MPLSLNSASFSGVGRVDMDGVFLAGVVTFPFAEAFAFHEPFLSRKHFLAGFPAPSRFLQR